MPQLGETVTEGTITRWAKQVGDSISEDEVLFEVSTDKVDSEVPSPVSGVLSEILVPEGETVDVGTRLAVISDGDAARAAPAAEAKESTPAPPAAENAPAAPPAADNAPAAPPVADVPPPPPAPISAPGPRRRTSRRRLPADRPPPRTSRRRPPQLRRPTTDLVGCCRRSSAA